MIKTNFRSTQEMKRRIAESRDRLFRVALVWCGDRMLADDLTQETMMLGIVNGHQLRDKDRLMPWLYSIMRNNWFRHMRRIKPQIELDEKLPCENGDPFCACQGTEMIDRVRRAVAALPEEQRQVISLVDLEELSYCEVAQILDIPIGTVMSRLNRARKNLLAKLDKPAATPGVSRNVVQLVE
jgi:RNA polymerase sigma-70 factor (ECF subfamily)